MKIYSLIHKENNYNIFYCWWLASFEMNKITKALYAAAELVLSVGTKIETIS